MHFRLTYPKHVVGLCHLAHDKTCATDCFIRSFRCCRWAFRSPARWDSCRCSSSVCTKLQRPVTTKSFRVSDRMTYFKGSSSMWKLGTHVISTTSSSTYSFTESTSKNVWHSAGN